jgi:hypothetical protein
LETIEVSMNNLFLDDKNYHFEVSNDPKNDGKFVLKVFQKTKTMGNVFLRDVENIPEGKLEMFASVFKAKSGASSAW